jgi:hypothetical protein
MATVTKWTNVAVAMQSAIGADITITGITLANPGVATSVAHGLTNGQYVVFNTTSGMGQIDERIVRVANKTNDTWELEGVNTTSFAAFSAGSCNLLTLGTSITTITTVNPSNDAANFIDVTTIHDDRRKEIPDLPGSMSYSFDNLWDPADAGQIALKTASDSGAKSGFKFTFGTGGKIMVFYGYVSFSGSPAGAALAPVTCVATLTSAGTPTFYAS